MKGWPHVRFALRFIGQLAMLGLAGWALGPLLRAHPLAGSLVVLTISTTSAVSTWLLSRNMDRTLAEMKRAIAADEAKLVEMCLALGVDRNDLDRLAREHRERMQ